MAKKILLSDCALAYIRTTAGGYVQVFYGDPVPDHADPDDVQRLLDEGFLREAREDELGGIVAPPDLGGGQVPGKDAVGEDAPPAVTAPSAVTAENTHAELDAYAKAHSIDLGSAKTKAEKADAIAAASSS